MFQQVLRCEICDNTFSGPAPHQQHLASEKHRKKVENAKYYQTLNFNSSNDAAGITAAQNDSNTSPPNVVMTSRAVGYMPVFHCSDCNAVCNTQEQFDCHVAGKNHQKKLNQKKLEAGYPSVGADTSQNMRCEICNISCSGIVPYRMHCEGAQHQKKLNQKKLEAGYPSVGADTSQNMRCDLCNITCSGIVPYRMHCEGAQHQKNLKRTESMQYRCDAVPNSNNSDNGEEWEISGDPSRFPSRFDDCVVRLKDLDVTVIEPDVVVEFL